MKNPFKAVGNTIGGMFHSATHDDSAAPVYTTCAVLVTPIVAPIVFIAAFFQKADPK
jgi:hypothetical protein